MSMGLYSWEGITDPSPRLPTKLLPLSTFDTVPSPVRKDREIRGFQRLAALIRISTLLRRCRIGRGLGLDVGTGHKCHSFRVLRLPLKIRTASAADWTGKHRVMRGVSTGQRPG